MAVLSFLFPIVGLILWAVKKNTEPDVANKCIKWAGIGFGVNVLLTILTSCMSAM